MKSLPTPQPNCPCGLCSKLRAVAGEFDLSNTLPAMPRVPKTLDEWKLAFKEAGL